MGDSRISKSEIYVEAATASILEHYMGAAGASIASCLAEVTKETPPIVREFLGGNILSRPQDSERQISWGITRREGKMMLALLIEQENSHGASIAEKIRSIHQNSIIQLTAARAHSSEPQQFLPRLPRSLATGGSISHVDSFPGSIGCMVRSLEEGEDWPGVLSASHVLSKSGKAQADEAVFAPGCSDGGRNTYNRCGSLVRYLHLSEYDQDAPDSNYLCCTDAALVKIDRHCKHEVPRATFVPKPDDTSKIMQVTEVIGGDRVAERLGQTVYKVGRTTGPTEGILDLVGVQRQLIRIGKKEYVYTNVLGVRSTQGAGKPFSRPGDSGSLVYTHDGKGIGLIVGGNEYISWVSPLDACLRELNVEILN